MKTIEEHDGYTVTRWIDENAGDTPEEREHYWMTHRYMNNRGSIGTIIDGKYVRPCVIVKKDPGTGEVKEYEFHTKEAYVKFETVSAINDYDDSYPMYIRGRCFNVPLDSPCTVKFLMIALALKHDIEHDTSMLPDVREKLSKVVEFTHRIVFSVHRSEAEKAIADALIYDEAVFAETIYVSTGIVEDEVIAEKLYQSACTALQI